MCKKCNKASKADKINLKITELIIAHDKATDKIVADNKEFFESTAPLSLKEYDERRISFQDLIKSLYIISKDS